MSLIRLMETLGLENVIQPSRGRPAGVTVLSCALSAVGAYLISAGVLVHGGIVPLAVGASLLGGLEVMGPLVFLIAGGVALVAAYGLFRLKTWGSLLTTILAFALVASAVPGISSAVVDVRIITIAYEAAKIIAAVVAIRYLRTETVQNSLMK